MSWQIWLWCFADAFFWISFLLLFIAEYMMLGLTTGDRFVCGNACTNIVPEATSFLDPEFGTCYCYFCPQRLMNSLFRFNTLDLFLKYAGCKDIHSLIKDPAYPFGLYYCKWNWSYQFLQLSKINGQSVRLAVYWLFDTGCS